jgi:hypothetical protein
MPHLSPPTLTESDTKAILAATASNPRDHDDEDRSPYRTMDDGTPTRRGKASRVFSL